MGNLAVTCYSRFSRIVCSSFKDICIFVYMFFFFVFFFFFFVFFFWFRYVILGKPRFDVILENAIETWRI